MKEKGRIGGSLDDFLKEEGIFEAVTARAIKRVIARQLDAEVKAVRAAHRRRMAGPGPRKRRSGLQS